MNALAALAQPFLGRPWAILLVAVVLILLDRIDRRPGVRGRSGSALAKPPLRLAALLWACLAVWELLVQLLTPEANIRVDWLLAWPALLFITLLSLTTAGLSAIRHR
jgi:hypothetical protein